MHWICLQTDCNLKYKLRIGFTFSTANTEDIDSLKNHCTYYLFKGSYNAGI